MIEIIEILTYNENAKPAKKHLSGRRNRDLKFFALDKDEEKRSSELTERSAAGIRRISLRFKLVMLYFFLAIIPIIVISTFSFHIYAKDTDQIEEGLMEYSSAQVAENIAGHMEKYRQLVAQISTDDIICSQYTQISSEQATVKDFALVRGILTDRFNKLAWDVDGVVGITLVTHALQAVTYDRRNVNSTNFDNPRWDSLSYRRSLLKFCLPDKTKRLTVLTPMGLKGSPEAAGDLVYFTYPAADFISGQTYGLLVLEVESSVFTDIINVGDDALYLDNHISPYSCISDSNGTIIASPETGLAGRHLGDISGLNPHITSQKATRIPGTDLSVSLFFQRGTHNFSDKFRALILALTAGLLAFFFLAVCIITKVLREKTGRIAYAMDEFGENLTEIDLDIDKDDEILSIISERFHKMTGNVTHLMHELQKKNEKIAFEADQRRRAEIKALQAQINPHFLYNALDRINWIAIENEQEEISEMLSGLARLLRYSISNVDILVPLAAELEWMKQYIFIQGKRFEARIQFQLNVSEEAESFPIYKMLLQPLVENCILHGMKGKKNEMRIALDAAILTDGRLRIRLSDNGAGMAPSRLAYVRDLIRQGQELRSEGIGISNVVKRMWLYYAEEGGISVESVLGEGTAFILQIPYRQ